MNRQYRIMKRCALICCSCCVILSLVFLAQIQEQKRQIQTLQNLKTEMAGTVAQLREEKARMADELAYKRQLIQTYEENGQAMEELSERIAALQSYYDKGVYLDSLAAELDQEMESQSRIEAYFKIEKGELEEILGDMELADRLKGNLSDEYQWGCLLPVGDGIWVQYEEDDTPDALPMGVVVQNPLLAVGYQDARAGMYLFDIQKRYPDFRVEETEMEAEQHFNHISYLRYTDDEFTYYYAALGYYDEAVIVYIVPNNG